MGIEQIVCGDCIEKLKELPDNYVDSIVTDPPYELGFLGKLWDNTKVSYNVDMWAEILRVLKPGGHLLSFGGARTYHRIACAIEDAGFEIRDMVEWIYGCLSEDSEVLTKDGYKPLHKLTQYDIIVVYDIEKDFYKWERPQRWSVYKVHKDTAYRIKSDYTDQIVSRNHRCLVEREGKLVFKTAEELLGVECMPTLPDDFFTLQERSGQSLGEFNAFQDKQETQIIRRERATITKIEYSGLIFCPTVSTGAFIARRNGQVFITGNSGFPKSLNISKAIDKMEGAKREPILDDNGNQVWTSQKQGKNSMLDSGKERLATDPAAYPATYPATHLATYWSGWGTALKPAHEPICLARKPLSEKTVAENVLKWGTGGINIDESRVGTEDTRQKTGGAIEGSGWGTKGGVIAGSDLGRFPANLIHDNSEEVKECFPDAGGGKYQKQTRKRKGFMLSGSENNIQEANAPDNYGDSGSAPRFFKSIIYQAKASKSERNMGCEVLEEKAKVFNGQSDKPSTDMKDVEKRFTTLPKANNHPTVKPISLMEYLIKMVTPKGGIVLDPFAGSGSTLVAAKQNGYQFIGIEKEAEYIKIIEARVAAAQLKPTELL